MAQVNVYRWDDEGAPQIVEGRPSEFINVLKKCLVDGYGTKSAAGWSVAHESLPEETPYIVFKNSDVDGSGGILTIQQGNDNTRNTVRIHGALDFISPSEQGRVGPYFTVHQVEIPQSYANNWVVIATSTAFIFLCYLSRGWVITIWAPAISISFFSQVIYTLFTLMTQLVLLHYRARLIQHQQVGLHSLTMLWEILQLRSWVIFMALMVQNHVTAVFLLVG